MDKEQPLNVPFKARINASRCILVAGKGAISVEFGGARMPFSIPYGMIRCMQNHGNVVLINLQKEDRLVAYEIATPNAGKVFRAILDRVG